MHKLFTDNPKSYQLQDGYDLKVFDDCHEMVEAIKTKNTKYKGLCRVSSGLSFNWRKKARDKNAKQYTENYDFEIKGYHYLWNENFNTSDYITNNKNLEMIGCIYTCKGHDLNYAGEILEKILRIIL